MNLEEMREKLGAITAKLQEYGGKDEFTNEDVADVEALNTEFEEITAKIEAKEKLENTLAKSTASAGRKTVAATPKVEVKATKADRNGGFNSMGEFLSSVRRAAKGDMDKRFLNNTAFERSGEDGGFLVPEEMLNDIAKKVQGDDALLGQTRQFTVSGNSLSLPTDELQPHLGGIQAYWVDEGESITQSKHKFGKARWQLNKLGALVKVTDELIEDAVALESYIRAEAPNAINFKINDAIMGGDGVGKPTGILNSDFKIAVAKESGQAADTVVARNIVKMYSRMLPASRANAAWYINPEVESQLRLMVDDNGEYIYLAPGSQMNQSPYGLLMGRPVIPMLESMRALGDEGDIIFADMSYYYTIVKSRGIEQAISSHIYFDQAAQGYRFIFRVDGGCPFKSPVQVQYGNYTMSSFITLADRA